MSVITHILSKLPINPARVRHSRRFATVAAVASLTMLGGAQMASAQTSGQQIPVDGGAILQLLGFTAFQTPSSIGGDPDFIDYDPVTFNYIANPYMAVVQGVTGTYPVAYAENQLFGVGGTVTLTHNVPGMISFGNLGGSLRYANDDRRALNGFGFGDTYGSPGAFGAFGTNGGGVPAGYGVWPLPGWLEGPSRTYDYSAFVSTNVDGVLTNGQVVGGNTTEIVGGDEEWILEPTFRSNAGDNFLVSEAAIEDDCVLRQEIRLFRNTAQMRWQIRNQDAVSHTVYLKFAVNNRAATAIKFDGTTVIPGQVIQPGDATFLNPAYFFTDPSQGPTLRSQVYGVTPDGTLSRPTPQQVDILGGRYQADTIITEPFHARHILEGYGATRPTSVFVGDSEDLFPILDGDTGFSPARAGVRYDKIEDGIAVGVYFGPITVAPGATSAPIITYYGNGNSSDRLEADFAIATEAEESFQYNANAVNTLTDQQLGNPTLTDTAKQFLTPQALDIYGSVYNRQLSESQFNIVLKDVRMSVTLPDGLRFATNAATGQPDAATKTVGDIVGDTDKIARWVAEPTGTAFGTVAYQMTATVGGITPLSRTVSRSVTIPATPLFNVSADYFQMIGFPFDFDRAVTNNNDTATIFNGLTKPTDLNPGSLTLFKWVPDPESVDGAGRYQPVTNIERGEGYFYRPAISRLLFLRGARPDVQATSIDPNVSGPYFQKVLERGWNMISNPWVYGVPVSFISLAEIDNNDPENDLNLTYFPDAVASGLVRGGIFFYNPDKRDYDFFQDYSQELRPYQAYWIYVEDRKILRIATPSQKQSGVIPTPDGSIPVTNTRQQKVGAINSGRAFPATQTSDNWKMQLVAKRVGANSSDTANDGMTLLGVSPNAKDGDDTRDLPKPPPVMNDYVSVRIMHEVKPGRSHPFAQDLKAPGGKKQWEIEVISDKDGPISLSWPNLSRLPKTVKLTLEDKATGRKVAMRNSSSSVVNVSANVAKRFVLTADKQATQPLSILNIQSTRERTRSAGGTRSYVISFKTTADATVQARITTMSGRTVNVLDSGRSVNANDIFRGRWSGRAQDGSQLPAGPYMLEVTARSTDDNETITVKKPILTLD
jgi:hypothetical protein